MRGVEKTIFSGHVRNPPTTVNGFVKEVTNTERTFQARADHCQRLPNVAASALASPDVGCSFADIREMIRNVIREELK